MSIATQMQRFKDIGDAIRNAIHTRNNEVEVDDLKFADFANVISTLNNINTDTYSVPTDISDLMIDLGVYNKVRKVNVSDFYQSAYSAGVSNGVDTSWSSTGVTCSLSQGGWSSNKLTVTGTATAKNTAKDGATKTGTASTTVDATSIYNNGYNAGHKMAWGTFTTAARGSTVTINCGFQPNFIAVFARYNGTNGYSSMYYNGTYNYVRAYSTPSCTTGTSGSVTTPTSTGFTSRTPDVPNFNGRTAYYFAMRT